MLFEASHQAHKVYLDGEEIFRYGYGEDGSLDDILGGIWHIISIPEGADGKTLVFEVTPSTAKHSNGMGQITVGEYANVYQSIILDYSFDFYISSAIIMLGIMLVGMYFGAIRRFETGITFLYLGLFAILIGTWLISLTTILQLFIGNYFIISRLPFWGIYLCAIPIILHLDSSYSPHHKSFAKPIYWVFIINFLLVTLLQGLGIRKYYDSLSTLHLLIGLMILYFVISMIYEWIKHNNHEAKVSLAEISIICIFGLLEIFNYYAQIGMIIGGFLQIGIVLYILVCSIFASIRLSDIAKNNLHLEYMAKIAYIDILTGGANRHAFERDLKIFIDKNNTSKNKWIGSFDCNHLKYFNDFLGHQKGDDYIKHTYNSLNATFGKYGVCYRIGGDEFTVLFHDVSDSTVEKLTHVLQKEVEAFGEDEMAGISVGCIKYTESGDIREYLAKADELMYENKRKQRSASITRVES